MYNPASMLLYRRHLKTCRHRKKGQNFAGCKCPIWIDGILNGKRYRRALQTTNWEKAERKKAALESGREDGGSRTLEETIYAWDSYLVTQKLRESTLIKYRRLMRQFVNWADDQGYILLRQITPEVLDTFRASRHSIAATTSLKELQTFRGYFSFCNDRGWCDLNPAKKIKSPKIPDNRVVPYTAEEVGAMLTACGGLGQEHYERLRSRALIMVMRHTGLRISDVLLLRKDQVRDGVVQLFTKKTGGHIFLPIPREVQLALGCLPLPKPLVRDNGYYFWNGQATGKRLLESAERTLRSVFKRAGVIGAHAHRFRHTLATEQEVADVLGISPVIVRKHYGKWSKARQDRIFDLMRNYQDDAIASAKQQEFGTSVVRGQLRRVN